MSDLSSEISSLHSGDDDVQSHHWFLDDDRMLTRRGTLTADVPPLGPARDDAVATLPGGFKEEEDLTPVPWRGPQSGFSFATKIDIGQGTNDSASLFILF